jgi:hypothetical protein
MNSNFEEAVKLAIKFLMSTGASKDYPGATVEPTELLYVFGLSIGHEFDDHPFCPSRYIVDDVSLNCLCMESDHDKGAFDLLSRIITAKLLRNEPLTQQVSLFAGMVLGGMKKAPPPEGKRLAKHFIANVHIVFLAHQLSRTFGLALTRNDESSVQESTCHAIAEALEALAISKTPRAIKDLLLHKSAGRVREVAQAIRDFQERQNSAGK